MFCEIFCSILSQGLTSDPCHTNGMRDMSWICAVILNVGNPERNIETHFQRSLQKLRGCSKAEGQPRIYSW